MRRPGLIALLLAAAALGMGAPSVADTVVVGYIPPGIDYGTTDDSEVPLGQVRADGLVVENLEPSTRDAGRREGCPPEGYRYKLIVLDPAALRDHDGTGTAAGGCDAVEYGVIDPEPYATPLGGGARLYTGSGPVPATTADTASGGTPDSLTPGVGKLCFAATSGGDEAGGGPLAATQPRPVVILYDPDA